MRDELILKDILLFLGIPVIVFFVFKLACWRLAIRLAFMPGSRELMQR